MADQTDIGFTNQRCSHFLNVGISKDMLVNAGKAAAQLCAQSGPVVGGTFESCHFTDYPQLLQELAMKESS